MIILLIAVGIAALFIFLHDRAESAGMWIRLLERKILDIEFTTFSRPIRPDPSVVIVAVNDRSIREMEPVLGRWPWPRRVVGEILDYLHTAGVRQIGVDILYPERNISDPAGDRYLEEQIRQSGSVLLAADFPHANQKTIAEKPGDLKRFRLSVPDEIAAKIPNIPPSRKPLIPHPDFLRAGAGIGGVHLSADPDGPTRRYQLLNAYDGDYFPSLALAMKLRDGISPPWTRIPLSRDGTILLNWYGPQGTFPYLEAHRILEARRQFLSSSESKPLHQEAAAYLKDKIILLGVTGTGLFDLRATPFSPVYAGVEVHATALSNLMRSDFIRAWPALWGNLYVLMIALATGLLGIRFRSSILEVVAALGLLMAVLMAAMLAFYSYSLWIPAALPMIVIFVIAAGNLSWNYFVAGRERRFIRGAFSKYLNEEVLRQLLEDPKKLELGGENTPLTILFSDIRGFTSLSENRPPDEVVALLNEYLTEMVDIVFAYGGTLDKFIGDAVMAFWGAPVKTEDHPEKAVQAALAMIRKVAELRGRWESEGKPPLRIGIGISTGVVTVGNIGSVRSQSYTVIGDEVNLASRLESLNKEFHTSLIISESVYARLQNHKDVSFEDLGEVRVKGKEKSVRIYGLKE